MTIAIFRSPLLDKACRFEHGEGVALGTRDVGLATTNETRYTKITMRESIFLTKARNLHEVIRRERRIYVHLH